MRKIQKTASVFHFRSIKTRACLLYMVEVYIHDNMTKLLSLDGLLWFISCQFMHFFKATVLDKVIYYELDWYLVFTFIRFLVV